MHISTYLMQAVFSLAFLSTAIASPVAVQDLAGRAETCQQACNDAQRDCRSAVHADSETVVILGVTVTWYVEPEYPEYFPFIRDMKGPESFCPQGEG